MRYVAAYCLAASSGGSPSAKDIEKILSSVGIDCDMEKANHVVEQLSGKKVDDVIAEGKSQMGTMPVGAAPVGAAAATESAAPAKEEKKEEEPEEESDDDMGFGLFD